MSDCGTLGQCLAMMGTLVVVLPGAANQEKYPSNDPSPHLFVSAVSPPVIIPSSADCCLQPGSLTWLLVWVRSRYTR